MDFSIELIIMLYCCIVCLVVRSVVLYVVVNHFVSLVEALK